MVGAEFASCWLKIGRAEEHLRNVKAELLQWKSCNPLKATKTSDPEGRRHSLIVEVMVPPPLDKLALIAGDCIHNLRAALDTLVYGIAVYESKLSLPHDHGRLQFPITETPDQFAAQKRRLKSLSVRVQAQIEQAQPYNRPHPDLPPLLRLLSEFDNVDKHRLLNVVLANLAQGRFSFTAFTSALSLGPHRMPVVPSHVSWHHDAIESGMEIAAFTLGEPNRDLLYEYEAYIVVSIAHSPGPSGRTSFELLAMLEVLIAEVTSIVNGFAKP